MVEIGNLSAMEMSVMITLLAAGALLVRVGMGWYGSGMMRSKNAAGAVLRNVIDLAVVTLAFWAIGAAIWGYSGAGVLGIHSGLIFDAKRQATGTTFMELMLVLIATAPLAGAVGERCKFFPLLLPSLVMGGFLIPLVAQWAWSDHGWLHRIGFFDVAGATVLHVSGGMAAAVGAIVAGPRTGKYNRDGSSNLIPGHNAAMASVGVMLILVGWLPYVLGAGSLHGGMSGAAMNVMLSASAGALVAVLISHARYGKPDAMLTYSGLLGGLVAICAAGGIVSGIGAVAIGAVAGIIVPTATVMLDLRFKVDDPAGGIAIHLIGGVWGTLALALFSPGIDFADKMHFLGIEALGIASIAAASLIASLIVFLLLKYTLGLRLSEDAEYDGADLTEHDLNAYPDFQQTMIKSYHLRQA